MAKNKETKYYTYYFRDGFSILSREMAPTHMAYYTRKHGKLVCKVEF